MSPMPKPMNDEDHDAFMERCMSDDVMMEDMPERGQRAATCQAQWEEMHKSAKGGIEKKAVKIELKADKPGSFTALIAQLGIVDHDNDVTQPGAFPDGKEILISAYQHASWMGALPVGKAAIKVAGDDVTAEGQFNLASATGKDHYETVKFSGGLQEWSYGFRPTEFHMGELDGKQVRYLDKVDPFEISPVLKGAGLVTATLGIKSREGQTFADHSEAVRAAVEEMVARAKSLADLRRKEGRVLSSANRARIAKLSEQLATLRSDLDALLADTEPNDGGKALLSLLRTYSQINGGMN